MAQSEETKLDKRFDQNIEITGTLTVGEQTVLTQADGDNRYLQSFTETDPIFVASVAHGITSTNINNWNTAYNWGDWSTGVTKSFVDNLSVDAGYAGYSAFMRSYDTRSAASTPQTYNSSAGIHFDFKHNATNGLSDGGSYNGVMYWRKYGSSTDWSGGGAKEIAYTDNGNLWHRYGSGTSWGSWRKILDTSNYTSVNIDADTLDGVHLTGSNSIFNNMGQVHDTNQTAAEAQGEGFGVRYLRKGTDGPTATEGHQWYGFFLGLGSNYPSSGSGSYGSMFYWGRQSQGSNPYLWARDLEGNSWGSWRKMAAGNADYATNAGSANLLDGIDSSQFLRSDTSDTATELRINNLGINVTPRTDSYKLALGGSIYAGNNSIDYVGQLHFNDNVRFYDDGNDSYLSFKYGDANYGGIVFYRGDGTRKGYLYSDNSGFGLLGPSGGWQVRTTDSLTEIYDRLDAPIIYDANDTGYYLDPNSVTNIKHLRIMGNWSDYGAPYDSQITIRGNYPSIQFRSVNANKMWLRHMDGSGHIQHYYAAGTDSTAWGIKHTMETNGTFYSAGSMRSPIFYDSNNTGYYTNPAGNSYINTLEVASGGTYPIKAITSQRYGVQVRNTSNTTNSAYGWWWFHDTNFNMGFHADGQGDKLTLTKDSDLIIYGSSRAPIFYDQNNTGYYADPSSTSVMYAINDPNNASYVSYKHSGSDFVSGTLVETDINASSQHGDSFVLDATGKSYSMDPPFMFTAQGYLYNYGIINYSGQHIGKPGFSSMKIFEYNGKLCFWWPRVSYWNSFEVRVRDAGGSSRNRVTNITNSTEPTGSKKVTVTMKYTPMYNYNYGTGNLHADRYYASNTNYYCDPDAWSRCYGFDSETRFAYNTYSDPDPGVTRDAKFGDDGIAATYVHTSNQFTTNGSYKSYSWAGMVGDYDQNSTAEKIIWTIGDSWNSLGNMYGLGYSYGAGYDHHLSIKNNGTTYHRISFASQGAYFTGTVTASSDHRAPIFYDSNDTNYYVDPNSSTSAEFAGQIRFQRNDSRRIFGDVQNGNNSVRIAGNWDTFDIMGRVLDWNTSNLHFGDGYNGVNHSSYYFRLGSSGNLNYFHVGGDGYFEGDVIAYYSDARLKQNVKPIENALDIIKEIRGVTFEWNKLSESVWKKKEGDKDFGLIAQEVEAVFPMGVAIQAGADEAKRKGYANPDSEHYDPLHVPVNEDEEYKTVRYDKMVSIAIQAIKEQQDTIEKLSKEIKELKKLINP